MSGLSGTGIDRALYPNPYAGDEKASGAYGRRAGAATGSPGGSQSGGLMAQRDMRDRMALQRIQAQSQQGQAYGQMFQQMAMLAAYFKHQQGAGNMGEPGTDTMPQQQPAQQPAFLGGASGYEHERFQPWKQRDEY